MGQQVGYENLTVSSSAVTFTGSTVTARARSAVIVCENDDVRWRADGTSPTASVGTLLRQGASFILRGESNLKNIEFIRTSTDAVVHGAFFSDLNDALLYVSSVTASGDVPHDSADDGNPVKIGAKAFTGNRPTVSNNDRVDLSADKHGHLFTIVTGSANNTTPVDVSGADADAKGSSTSVFASRSFLVGLAPVGNEWDRLRTVGDAAPGLGTLRTSPTGHNFANITSATSTAVMAAAGVLHTITINTVSADGTITLHNDPDSADTPFGIITVVSSGFASVTLHYDIYLSAGLYIVTSSAVNITVSYAL